MINNNYIIVFDFETSGVQIEENEPVQIASVTIDPYKLEIIPGSEFNSLMKPIEIFSGSKDEIDDKWNKCWKAWEVNKKTKEQLADAPLPGHVWKAFAAHTKKYHTGGWTGKPIPAGHNIQSFDLPFADKLSKQYKVADKLGRQQLFNSSPILDTRNYCFQWFENSPEPDSYSMDKLRPWFGMSAEGAHDALQDVKDCAEILIKFMKLNRRFAPRVTFKGSFAK